MGKASTLTDDRDDRMQSPSNDSLILYGHVDIIAFAINSEWRCFECDRNIRRTKDVEGWARGRSVSRTARPDLQVPFKLWGFGAIIL